jgi:hypothetical protein
MLLTPAFDLVSAVDLPPESDYVVVKDGHLSVNGVRERYWSAIGKLYLSAKIKPGDDAETRAAKIAKSRHATDVIVDRLVVLGFNAVRLWDVAPNTEDYVVGDGSSADCLDYFLALVKEKGFRVWCAGLGNRTRSAAAEDVDIAGTPDTAEAWQTAVRAYAETKTDLRHSLARVWDPRLEALQIERMKEIATHTNKHTGLRWCDDPMFAVWELSNEEWWVRRMLSGKWQKEPEFFRNQLVGLWNEWLRSKYGDRATLTKAWGDLLPDEDLESGTILFAPMAGKTKARISMNDANPLAAAALDSAAQTYSRDDFAPARGSDVLEFLLSVQFSHKEKLAAAVKTWGRSTKLSPLIYDTGIGYEIQSQYLHQNADAVAHDAYVSGWGPEFKEPDLSEIRTENQRRLKTLDAERISANVGPWVNWLLKPPAISQGVPWLEHNKTEGKPFIVYETQIQQPAKYRADFPLRLAALATIQDWDWISWHYFSPHDDIGEEELPWEKALDVTSGSHPQGYHYTYDEVQNAMMRAAAFIFRDELLEPAMTPTKFIYGRKSLLDPASMDYAGSYGEGGFDMLQTTYQHGVRIEIDPEREDDEVIGPVVTFAERKTHNPYTPTPEIVFDWKKGFLSFDAPTAVAWTGLLANYGEKVEFANGVTLRDVEIVNPDGIYDPIRDDERYIAFALTSEDGKPLSETKRAALSLVSTSFNTGFSMNPDDPHSPKGGKSGSLPVLVARVGGTIEAPALDGMRYTLRDWNMTEIGSGTIIGGTLTLRADEPVFLVELER